MVLLGCDGCNEHFFILYFCRKATPANEYAHAVVVSKGQHIAEGEAIGVYGGVMYTDAALSGDPDSDMKQVYSLPKLNTNRDYQGTLEWSAIQHDIGIIVLRTAGSAEPGAVSCIAES